jgi:hypothetical protein
MTEMTIGDQTVRYDRDATAAVYGTIEHGDAEKCGCIFCKNFAVQRDIAYPASFRALLEQLGIDPKKEGEAFEYGPVAEGCHLYGGWFYFVGEMVTAGERTSNATKSREFAFWFTATFPGAAAFGSGPLLAIEFATHVKWLLPDDPDSGRRSRAR